MFQSVVLYIILIFLSVTLSSSSETCTKESEKEGACQPQTSSRMNDAVKETLAYENTFITAINESLTVYNPCVSNNCSCFFSVLKNDLSPFKDGITRKMVNEMRSRGTSYVVFQNRLYRSSDCVFPARCSGVEHFLLELLPKLLNTEFVLNTRDWPQSSRHFGDAGPIFSFSKTSDYYDIHYPAWAFWEGGPAISTHPRGIGRWDIMRDNLMQEGAKWPWNSKVEKGFFRGSRTSDERDALILLSREHPDLVDAQYTKNQAWKSSVDTLHAEPADVVTFEHHCRYKYLFNMRGVAASFRLKHLFLCGSLVIHFGEEWTEFFYEALKPWVHYVPISPKASKEDIMAMLSFLRNHDDLAAEIAARGQQFIKEHLRMKDVQCYWRHLLRRYTKLLKYSVSLDPSFQEIK